MVSDISDSSTSPCIDIDSNDVVFDCNGHTIDGDDAADYGIYASRPVSASANITVTGCTVTDWDTAGIYFYSINESTITNTTVSSSAFRGIRLHDSHGNTISNITAKYNGFGLYIDTSGANSITDAILDSNTGYGAFFIVGGTENNTLSYSTISNNTNAGVAIWGVLGELPENNTIYNNLLNNTLNVELASVLAVSEYTNNFNSSRQTGTRRYTPGTQTGGNYYATPAGTGYSETCTDLDRDGFCDAARNLTNGSSIAYDYLPMSGDYVAQLTIDAGVIFDPLYSNTNYTFHSQYNVESISVNESHIEINRAMLKAEPDTGTVNCTIYEHGTAGTHYRAYNLTNTSFVNNVSITQGGYTLDDSVLIFRNRIKDGVALIANATYFINFTHLSFSTYNITSYLGTTEPMLTSWYLFTTGAFHNMTQLRDIYANITFYDTTPNDTFYINTTWFKTNRTGTYALGCCDTLNQSALNDTRTTITVPLYSNQTTVADNVSARMTVADSAGNTNATNATGTIKSHWWDNYWEQQENW